MQLLVELVVPGRPAPAGSKDSQVVYVKNKQTGRREPLVRNGRVVSYVRDNNPRTKEHRAVIEVMARELYEGDPFDGAVHFEMVSYEPRPKSHYRTGRFAHLLKPDAPAYPARSSTGDSAKLRRNAEDALQGIVYTDDKRIVSGRDEKRYVAQGKAPHVEIRVYAMSAQTVADASMLDEEMVADEAQLALVA